MKKIINGRLYDTETAKDVGCDYHGSPRDFSYWSEHLYQKRTGEFFLHGEGGPNSRYSRSLGPNEWCGGEKIIPLTYDAAREWAEKHMDADDYQDLFGDVPEADGDDVLISVKLPAGTDAKLRRLAAQQGTSLTAVIRSLIDNA